MINYLRPKTLRCLGLTSTLVTLVSCGSLPLSAQTLPTERRLGGKLVEAVFEEQRLTLQKSSAVIYAKRRPISYGVVMTEDGYILTKSSELYEFDRETKKDVAQEITVILGEERYEEVEIIAEDVEWDLALIKVPAEGLTPVTWAETSDVDQGSWVVANGSSTKKRRRVNVGIISAKSRKIDGALPVIMGVGLEKPEEGNGVTITGVSKDSGAEEAGMKKGDLITKFDGVEVNSRDDILDIIREKQPGDRVNVVFQREGKEFSHDMELKDRKEVSGDDGSQPSSRNDQMSGEFSARRNSFPRVLQTDILHNNRQTGGPLLLMNGEAIGIVIARANRAESFAIPLEEAIEVYNKLKK